MIPDDCPIRLSRAAELAFPDGSMTASGLRREAAKGRLVIERIAGKDYTTLANIRHMRLLCQLHQRAPDCGSASAVAEKPSTSSGTANISAAQAAALATVQELKRPLSATLPTSTPLQRRPKANVIRLKSR